MLPSGSISHVQQPTGGASLLFDFFAAGQRIRTLLSAAMATAPLRPDEYAVYSVLVDQGPSSPTAMARAVGMPPTTMSHYVRAMSERGHIERRTNPRDRRSAVLALTPAGRSVHATTAAAFEEANRRFVAALKVPDQTARDVLREINEAAAAAFAELAATTLEAAG